MMDIKQYFKIFFEKTQVPNKSSFFNTQIPVKYPGFILLPYPSIFICEFDPEEHVVCSWIKSAVAEV